MCGRYLTPDQSALERYWGLVAPADFTQSYNVAPSQRAPLIRVNRDGHRELGMLTWGFKPPWSDKAWINARSETVFRTKAFASAAEKRRCLVPALGWYEWQGSKPPRVPYVFHVDGFVPIAFAGIWTGQRIGDEWQRSFAILTRAAAPPFNEIHPRMPLVLDPAVYDTWLDPHASPEAAAEALARPFDAIAFYAVGDYVNKPAHDDARCIRPV